MSISDQPAGFTELDERFLHRVESIRDDVAVLLADALHGCVEDQRPRHVERASMIHESLAKMHTILWRMVNLASRDKDYQAGN